MARLRSFWHFGRITFFLLDFVLLWAAVICAFKLSPKFPDEILYGIWLRPELKFIGYGLPLFMAIALQLAGVQANQAGFRTSETIARTFFAVAGGILVFVVLHILVKYELIGRFVQGFTLLYATAFILGSRMLVWKLAERTSRNVLLYGTAVVAAKVRTAIKKANLPIRLLGYTRLSGMNTSLEASEPPMAIGSMGLYGLIEKNAIEEIVVEVPDALAPDEREALLYCTGQGVNVVDLGYFYERHLERVYVTGLRESWFWGYDPNYAHPVYFAFKRVLDIVFSIIGLMACLPIAPLVLLLIKLQDGGPALYSQLRTGLYNRPFRIYKIRSMRVDAEKNGAQWAETQDSRITFLGRALRKTRFDEVPQFWNILQGDMSFIGPRPERPEMVDVIEKEVPFFRYRHLIKPGLSGWAQINYPYGASIEDARQKLSYDLHYLKNASVTIDMLILLRTIVAMVQGAR